MEAKTMYGAIIGDIVGSRFEFDRSPKVKKFKLFDGDASFFTDDTVMTIAVADALLGVDISDEKDTKNRLVERMKYWGRKYPDAGYGLRFDGWLWDETSEPYNSFGNGSAMRVAPAGWLYDDLETTRKVARWTAEVTHNHPEGIKGAESVASVIYLARTGTDKETIKKYVEDNFYYDLSRTCDEIRPSYRHVESCQETVPEAMAAFLEGTDFEDVLRNAVSLGGDCDTLTDIACAMAEGCYEIPEEIIDEAASRLDREMIEIIGRFNMMSVNG